ncbi:hypothetical protein BP6252_06416 [Coleophoma cylindrospora]|uniref:Cytochrome P450 n=1 Tax=Coleophoma cylindrospora TaxID=1849047 RepID=A0A3D8RMZ4_9HELO|nr:hypothetical protein BP6252_06416 [Coleophoma cylindrospora]
MALSAISCIGVAIVSIAVYFFLFANGSKIHRNGKPLRRPPNTLPLVGNGILFLAARHKLFSWFVKCERQFGYETFRISVPTLPPGVVINDPKNLEYVFKQEGIFAKGDFFKARSWDLFGNGIINADGDLWKVQRKAGLHFLNNANLKVLTETALPKYLGKSVQALETTGSDSVVDMESVFHELTTQLMGKMAYNMEMHSADDFSVAFEYASGAVGERFQNPLWQISEVFLGAQLRKSIARVRTFGSVIVSNAVKQRHESGHEIAEPLDSVSGSLINSLLDSIDDETMVADAALNYLSAGRDTTAQALTWAFYLLMRHPWVVQAIRSEISAMELSQQNVGKAVPLFHPSLLPYTMATFYETLRLYPPVPFELKQCEKETTLPDGTYLPKTAVLVWCTWAMNRSKITWGDDADKFEPGRWLDGNGSLISRSASEYPVFNGGPRTCLGKKMAEVIAVQVIATLVTRFEFCPVDSGERISKNSLTLPMEGGLPCYVKKLPDS